MSVRSRDSRLKERTMVNLVDLERKNTVVFGHQAVNDFQVYVIRLVVVDYRWHSGEFALAECNDQDEQRREQANG